MCPPVPPDFAAEGFDPCRLPDLLRLQGAVLLRGLLAPALLTRCLPTFEEAFARADQNFDAGRMDAGSWSCFHQFGNVNPIELTGFYGWIQDILKQPGLSRLLPELFGSKPWLLLNYAAARRQSPQLPRWAIRFHQEHEFIDPFERAVSIWIPITPAGETSPALEIWLGSPQQTLLNLEMSRQERDAVSAAIPPEALWHPSLQPGDVLIFTHYTLHRTWLTSGMHDTRYNFELRLIPDEERGRATTALLPCHV